MEDIDGFYDKVFGKESALFIGTLWLGMIAKHMDEVRKAEDEAYELMGINIFKWLNKLRTLYDNVEFKTDIPRYKEKINFENWLYNPELDKYELKSIEIEKKDKFLVWFEQIKLLIEKIWRMGEKNNTNEKIIFNKEHQVLLEIGECQRELYREIEKKHLIMPPEKQDMKDLAKSDWIDRGAKKELYNE
jgi:hypothetical protein